MIGRRLMGRPTAAGLAEPGADNRLLTMQSIETRGLKVGDVLTFTRDTVMSRPVALLKTKPGKVDFVVRTKSGSVLQKSWNRHTIVCIDNRSQS